MLWHKNTETVWDCVFCNFGAITLLSNWNAMFCLCGFFELAPLTSCFRSFRATCSHRDSYLQSEVCPKTVGGFSATILPPSSTASSPSPSIPLFIRCFNRPCSFIPLAIFFAFISLPQVSAFLSSRVPPLSPKLLHLDIPRRYCPIGDCVQGYWPLLPACVQRARVLYWPRRHCENEEDKALRVCTQALSYKCCTFLAEPQILSPHRNFSQTNQIKGFQWKNCPSDCRLYCWGTLRYFAPLTLSTFAGKGRNLSLLKIALKKHTHKQTRLKPLK